MISSRLLLSFSVSTAVLTSLLLASLAPTTAEAAAYRMRGGSLSGPILFDSSGLIHSYSGIDLNPGASLIGVSLRDAFLESADLRGSVLREANLRDSWLYDADLTNVDLELSNLRGAKLARAILRGARLAGLNLFGTDLTDADLRGADLTGAFWLQEVIGSPTYDDNTILTGAKSDETGTPFDPVAAGWTYVSTPIPEPGTALLVGLGLMGLVTGSRSQERR